MYTLVERSAALRSQHERDWHSNPDLPTEHQHVILANELLDNLAFDIAERSEDGWAPVLVDAVAGELVLQPGEIETGLAFLDELAPDVDQGSRVPVATQARAWVDHARAHSDHLLVFDYGETTAVLAARQQPGWLRTYAGHERGGDPLDQIGHRDITHDVPIDQLPPPDNHQRQADWLQSNGLPERVEQARQTWTERAHIGDLEAMVARSAIGEAEALTDPTGLGAFHTLHWRGW